MVLFLYSYALPDYLCEGYQANFEAYAFHCLDTLQMRFVKPYQLFLNTMKETKGKRGRLLGLDVGDKYVGIAVSDPDNQVASPLRWEIYHAHGCSLAELNYAC